MEDLGEDCTRHIAGGVGMGASCGFGAIALIAAFILAHCLGYI